MKALIYIIIALGLLEIVSNLFHLLRGNKENIGLSAKKQHQELSLELGYRHFYVKAIIMFVFGILFTVSGIIALYPGNNIIFKIVLGLFAIYGIAQSLFYKRPLKVWMSLVVYILPFIILLLLSGNVKGATSEMVNDCTQKGQFVFPFLLGSEPIKRLLVINFIDDPEYEIIEPQFYDDPVYGKGLRVLIYRTDKKIDVYYQPGVLFDSTDFAVGKGLGNALETKMTPAHFEITECGVDIDIAFTDFNGKRIELCIKEYGKKNYPFPFLAPVGNDVENPSKLFLVYMREFEFVKRNGTVIRAKAGDRVLSPATFPIKRNGEKVYFARYASKLVIGEINSPATVPMTLDFTQDNITLGAHHIKLDEKHKVQKYWIENGEEKIEIIFDDGFPDLLTLRQHEQVKGHWQYAVSGTIITGGVYLLERKGELVTIGMKVTRKWKPRELPLSFMVFTSIVRSFRTWPTSYKWDAVVNLEDMTMQGHWHRN